MTDEKDVYAAVADPTRRQLLDLLAEVDELPLYELTSRFDMGRTAVSKHLAILKEAGLVDSRKVGRETRYRLNAKPLKEIQDWVSFYEKFWMDRLSRLQILLEEQKMTADVILDFTYSSTVAEVWNALTDSDMLAQWIWDNNFKAEEGYQFRFQSEPNEYWDGIVTGEVLVVDEPNQLAYTWASAGETTTITWTLTKVAEGTQLHFEQTGFSEETKATPGAIAGATYAWTEFGNKLASLLA
ncbi:metalloregulator ArsR/SmtB family transcription factor [Fundicoccus culcitae]|uniref:Metalloregulator ArsR/SmtB family transcription factor n=1 Tax=Fundicoccus culcitae TaxID=2969821 RepID=A0ABY5P244_9LACT|nr:metalloregulator ArsR/SmtB family transcription factor [Fundicoccus culcitae]UUX32777.1 metalloregulator ArsR/SmtB family transcription factor [Fundicoccus culcitae]